ncbi:MAG: PQQ-binding-like beta-propeller repeat protein [Phycisphaerae bacterium]
MQTGRMRLLAGMLIWTIALTIPTAAAEKSGKWGELGTLIKIRDRLRNELRDRSAADAKKAAPLDVTVELDQSWRRGNLTMTLRRQGSRWLVREVSPLPDSIPLKQIDATGLSMTDEKLTGPVVFQVVSDPEDDTEAAKAEAHTITLDLDVRPTEPKLVLTFRRFKGDNWVLQYTKDGEKWVFEKELKAPRIFYNDGGPFERKYSPIEPDEEGRFDARIDLTFKGTHEQRGTQYTKKGQPEVTFSGRIINGRLDTTWLRKAPGGKGMFGSGQDALRGVIRSSRLSGTYVSSGAKGRWMGSGEGAITPAPRDPVAFLAADDPDQAPKTLDQATVRAARAYREIRALAMALRNYPMPVTDTVSRVLVPAPQWPDEASEKNKTAYLSRLVGFARQAASLEESTVPTDHVAPADDTFGPYFGREVLANARKGNPIPKVDHDAAQRWQPMVDWQMTGPFPVYDQDAPVRAPEVPAVDNVAYQRTQLFTDGEGGVRQVNQPARWIEAGLAGATVVAPNRVEASSGSWRYITWYGRSVIDSPTEQTVWLSVRMEGQGMIWLNGQPVWKAGLDFTPFQPAVFQVTLKKGTNRLLVRCASNNYVQRHHSRVNWHDGYPDRMLGLVEFTSFSLHICTAGKPNPRPTVTSKAGPSPSLGERYRGDGSGVYPDANVPTAWDLKTGTNVAWSIEMPMGTADPVVRAGKIFVMAEPNRLHCLDAGDGSELWKKQIVSPSGKEAPRGEFAASVAPVVTDDDVYVYVGSGTAACLGHDGTVRWMVDTPGSWNHPNMGNPILIEGQYIVQSHLPGGKEGQWGLISLDADDGKVRWTARGPEKRTVCESDRAAGLGNGLAVMQLVNGEKRKTIVITGGGAVVDTADGTLLHRDIFHVEATRTPPYVVDDVVYTAPVLGQEAAKLWLDEQGRVGVRTLWQSPPKLGRGQVKANTTFGPRHWMKAPVIKDGRMYIVKVDSAHVPQHYPVQWTQLDIYDTTTGKRLSRMRQVLIKTTDPTIPPVIVGDRLYVGDGGWPVGGFGGTTTHGQMAVLRVNDAEKTFHMHTATRQGLFGLATMLSQNIAPRSRCAPVVEGDRLYLRGLTKMVCLAITRPEGKRYQQQQAAAMTVRRVVGRKPVVPQVTELSGSDELPAGEDLPISRAGVGAKGDRLWVLGPVDKARASAALEAIGADDGTIPEAGKTITIGGKEFTWTPAKSGARLKSGEWNARELVGGKQSDVSWVFTVLKVGRSRKLTLLPSAVVTGTWIDGKKVQPKETLSLDLGYYPMLMQVELSQVPVFLKTPRLTLGFASPKVVRDTPEMWERRVHMLADQLRDVLKLLPGSAEARSARIALENAGLEARPDAKRADPPEENTADPTPRKSQPKASAPDRATAQEDDGSAVMIYVGIAAVVVIVLVLVLVMRARGSKEDDVFQG